MYAEQCNALSIITVTNRVVILSLLRTIHIKEKVGLQYYTLEPGHNL